MAASGHLFQDFIQEINTSALPDDAKQIAIVNMRCLQFIDIHLSLIVDVIQQGISVQVFTDFYQKTQSSKNISSVTSDCIKGVLRDSEGTSFHINFYYDDTDPKTIKNLEQRNKASVAAKNNFSELLSGIKEIILNLKSFNRLIFILKFRMEDYQMGQPACLDNRVRPALQWGITALNSPYTQLSDIIHLCSVLLPEENLFAVSFNFCKQHSIEKCFLNNKAYRIDNAFLKSYFLNALGWSKEDFPNDINAESKEEESLSLECDVDAIGLFRQGNVVGKVVSASLGDDQHLDFLLNQLANPKEIRPVRALQFNINRSVVFNTFTGHYENRELKGERGRAKDTEYIKKTAVSLYPPSGKIHTYDSHQKVTFFFKLDNCKFSYDAAGNVKYIFENNASTNVKWWVGEGQQTYRSVSLATLKENQAIKLAAETIPAHNELLVKPSKKAFFAIGAPENTLVHRLNALRVQLYSQHKLSASTIQLIIVTPETGHKEYNLQSQAHDIFLGLKQAPADILFKMAVQVILSLDLRGVLFDELLNFISRDELKVHIEKMQTNFIMHLWHFNNFVALLGEQVFKKFLMRQQENGEFLYVSIIERALNSEILNQLIEIIGIHEISSYLSEALHFEKLMQRMRSFPLFLRLKTIVSQRSIKRYLTSKNEEGVNGFIKLAQSIDVDSLNLFVEEFSEKFVKYILDELDDSGVPGFIKVARKNKHADVIKKFLALTDAEILKKYLQVKNEKGIPYFVLENDLTCPIDIFYLVDAQAIINFFNSKMTVSFFSGAQGGLFYALQYIKNADIWNIILSIIDADVLRSCLRKCSFYGLELFLQHKHLQSIEDKLWGKVGKEFILHFIFGIEYPKSQQNRMNSNHLPGLRFVIKAMPTPQRINLLLDLVKPEVLQRFLKDQSSYPVSINFQDLMTCVKDTNTLIRICNLIHKDVLVILLHPEKGCTLGYLLENLLDIKVWQHIISIIGQKSFGVLIENLKTSIPHQGDPECLKLFFRINPWSFPFYRNEYYLQLKRIVLEPSIFFPETSKFVIEHFGEILPKDLNNIYQPLRWLNWLSSIYKLIEIANAYSRSEKDVCQDKLLFFMFSIVRKNALTDLVFLSKICAIKSFASLTKDVNVYIARELKLILNARSVPEKMMLEFNITYLQSLHEAFLQKHEAVSKEIEENKWGANSIVSEDQYLKKINELQYDLCIFNLKELVEQSKSRLSFFKHSISSYERENILPLLQCRETSYLHCDRLLNDSRVKHPQLKVELNALFKCETERVNLERCVGSSSIGSPAK